MHISIKKIASFTCDFEDIKQTFLLIFTLFQDIYGMARARFSVGIVWYQVLGQP